MNADERSRNVRERIILTVYSIYTVAMVAAAVLFHWASWIVPVIIIANAASVAMAVRKYRTYEFRAAFTTVMTWMNFSIYMSYSKEFTAGFSTMVAMIILLTIYCIPNLTYYGLVVYIGHLLYHLIFLRDFVFRPGLEGMQDLIRIVSVFVSFYLTYRLTKTQVESNEIMQNNIDEIRKAQQSKDDFMANMSHEIRTPINTVCGISEMALKGDLSEETRECIYDIQTAGRQLLSLVSDILDFSELSSGKMEIVPDTYNITSTLNDILNMVVAKTSGKNIELVVDCDAKIPRGLVGDEQKIRRAILNVLDNAIKFTDEGGVLLSLSFRKEAYGGNLIVSVQDTGIGIDEDMQEFLFESFSQMDAGRNRRAAGMGLGLAIAQTIAERMGGFITVRSTVGKGTEVKLVFPQKVNDPAPITALNNPQKSKAMLYLDLEKYNNAFVRDNFMASIRHIVEQLGVIYRRAKSLAELKRRIEHEEFDFLFVSWKEYCEDREYFETLSQRMKVVLVLERDHKESVLGSHLLCVYKPFHALTIASVLNGNYVEHFGRAAGHGSRFTAPEAQVLIVDDNLMNLKVAEGLLRPYKVKVFVAESGREAIQKVENQRFDMIFMDHMMPEMDGVETFHRIRQKPGNYFLNVPIVALTANAIGGAREMFLQEGFSDYVAKPIELSALDRVLQKFIPEEKILREDEDAGDGSGSKTHEGNGGSSKTHKENGRSSVVQAGNDGSLAGHAGNGKSPKTHEGSGSSSDTDALFVISGIDTELGLRYCGGKREDYLEVIQTYHKIGKDKKNLLRAAYESKDWKNYTILVHAVKSTSLGIGAAELSEAAKALEEAGKKEDIPYIEAHTGEVLAEYGRLLDAIGADRVIFPNNEEVQQMEPEALTELKWEDLQKQLERLKELAGDFDQEECLVCLKELYDCSYRGEALKTTLSGVADKIGSFDYMGAVDALDEIMERIGA